MKKINIFLAGAKDIIHERNALKALAHDLNKQLKYRIAGIDIVAQSYEDFKDDQDVYYDFIVNQADIVIFILKDKIGEVTQKEFVKAANAYNEKKLPDIMVFLSNTKDENSSEIHIIKDLIKTHLGESFYYVNYNDTKDLKSKAKERILNYMWPPISKKMRFLRILTGILGLLLLGGFGYNLWQYLKPSEPILLFAGGGSVANYINKKLDPCIELYPNSIYSRMPSSHAWVFLNEEANKKSFDSIKHKDLDFIPVCLSANEANEDDLVPQSMKEKFKENNSILSYYVGRDTLVLYLSNQIWEDEKRSFNFYKNDSNTLSFKDLARIIKNYSKYIYTTRSGSGTLLYYQSHAMSKADADLIDLWLKGGIVTVFNEMSDLRILNSEKNGRKLFAIMGSKNYFIKELESCKEQDKFGYKELKIAGDNDQILNKKMFIYFVGQEDPEDERKILIPNSVYSFLKKYDESFKLGKSVHRSGLIIKLNEDKEKKEN